MFLEALYTCSRLASMVTEEETDAFKATVTMGNNITALNIFDLSDVQRLDGPEEVQPLIG